MAGMFYSLQEAADKLGLTEEEVKQLAADGKLREFRDGSNVMFKIDEVEGLAAESVLDLDDFSMASESDSDSDDLEHLLEMNTIDELPGADDETMVDEAPDDLIFEADANAEPEGLDADEVLETLGEESIPLIPQEAAPHESDGLDELLDLAAEVPPGPGTAGGQILEPATDDNVLEPMDDLQLEEELGLEEAELTLEEETLPTMAADREEDVDLAGDTQVVPVDKMESAVTEEEADLSGGFDDTALTSSGINVLGESDAEFKLTDDTLAETLAGLGGTGDSTSLEDIEDDINLDSFGGSGTGLLDLSLQADDTSLGGILDEIYTSDEGGEGPTAEDGVGSTGEVSADLDAMDGDEGAGVEEFAPALGRPIAGEVAPDSSSNLLGALLFLPILVLTYTAIVAVSALNGTVPGILSGIQGFIWYVLGGLALVGVIVGVMGLTSGMGDGTKKPRAKKDKKEKKPKKEKKARPPKKSKKK